MLTNNRTHFFDAHMKLRIALQLVLDALPFLAALVFGLTIYGKLDPLYVHAPIQWLGIGCLYIFTYGSIPLFILGIWTKHRAAVEFACYPGWKTPSLILRLLSFIATCLSVLWLFTVFFG